MRGRQHEDKAGTATSVTVRLQPDQLEALDAWIARHDAPQPSRSEAIRRIIAGTLASDRPSTILPNLVTGRDIV